MVSSNAYIEQLAGKDNESDVTQTVFDSSVYLYQEQTGFAASADSVLFHIYPAQNPLPARASIERHKDNFSDSPDNAPAMLDLQRFAYGRSADGGMTWYGSLFRNHGVLLRQSDFGLDNDVHCFSFTSSDAGSTFQKDYAVSVDITAIQNLVVSSDLNEEQFDYLLIAVPVPYSSKNAVDSDVYIRLSNHSVDPLDSSTLVFRINGEVQDGVVSAPFFAGYGGLDLTWENDQEFDYGSRVDLSWEVFDTSSPANRLLIEYWFTTVTDETGPRLSNIAPADDATGVSISTSVVFDVTDSETGVDISTLELFVNNLLVEADDTNLTIISISGGYRVQYVTPTAFLYGDVIPVVVKVSDLSLLPNALFFVWSFTTVDSTAPVLINMDPTPCSTNVERIRNISFEVVDSGHGLDENSIIASIDNKQKDSILIIPIVHRFD